MTADQERTASHAGIYLPDGDEMDAASTASHARIQQIIEILENPEETDLGLAMRMVAVEIATTFGSRTAQVGGAKLTNDRIKNLRELSKQIQESADMSNRDFLNFDGPRFQFVLKEIVLLMRNSIVKAGLPAETADHILRVFRDEFLAQEQVLRRETTKLDPSTMTSPLRDEGQTTPPEPAPTEPAASETTPL